MSLKSANGTLASAVADDGTFTISYPDATDAGTFYGAVDHKLVMGQSTLTAPGDFSLSFGASNITVTNKTGASWASGTEWRISLQTLGKGGDPRDNETGFAPKRTAVLGRGLVMVNLGAPDTADVNGIFESTSQAAGSITLGGALASGGVVTLDVPRNIVVDSGGADTATITFTGTDEYGNTLTEDITLNGTTAVAGKKAFKTVTAVSSSGAIANGAFAGPGDVLGLPVFLPSTGLILAELEDGAAATAGTAVAGVSTAATATTGDVRGTYDPNSACDGAKDFQLVVALGDASYKGVAQYAG